MPKKFYKKRTPASYRRKYPMYKSLVADGMVKEKVTIVQDLNSNSTGNSAYFQIYWFNLIASANA